MTAIFTRSTGMRASRVVVHVVGESLPGRGNDKIRIRRIIERLGHAVDDTSLGIVGIHRADHSSARVVEERHFRAKLPACRIGAVTRWCVRPAPRKERLELLDNAALVVVTLPAAD